MSASISMPQAYEQAAVPGYGYAMAAAMTPMAGACAAPSMAPRVVSERTSVVPAASAYAGPVSAAYAAPAVSTYAAPQVAAAYAAPTALTYAPAASPMYPAAYAAPLGASQATMGSADAAAFPARTMAPSVTYVASGTPVASSASGGAYAGGTYAAAPVVAPTTYSGNTYAAAPVTGSPTYAQPVAYPAATYAAPTYAASPTYAAPVYAAPYAAPQNLLPGGSYVPPVPGAVPYAQQAMQPPAPPAKLTEGIPDLDAISTQKAAYEKSLEDQAKHGEDMLQLQKQQQTNHIYQTADAEKQRLCAQIDQQAKQQELQLSQKYSAQVMSLQQEYQHQKLSLEKQANELAMEYTRRKTQEDMMRSQYEMQTQHYEDQLKIYAEMQRGQQPPAQRQVELAPGTQFAVAAGTFRPPQAQPQPQPGASFVPAPVAAPMQADAFVGVWVYGNTGDKYTICKTPEGALRFDEQHPSGQQAYGILRPEGDYLVTPLHFTDGNLLGTLKLRLVPEKNMIVSNFKGASDNEWDPDTVAYRGTQMYGQMPPPQVAVQAPQPQVVVQPGGSYVPPPTVVPAGAVVPGGSFVPAPAPAAVPPTSTLPPAVSYSSAMPITSFTSAAGSANEGVASPMAGQYPAYGAGVAVDGMASAVSGYTVPATTYVQPATTYLQPAASYVAPPTQYAAPPTQFAAPPTQYAAPPTQLAAAC